YWNSSYVVDNRVEQQRKQVTTTRTVNQHFDKFEEALDGVDFEIGLKIPVIDKIAETRVFGGYYKYSSKYGEDIKGWKSRLEIRALPALIIDAELYEDKKLHGTDYYVGVRLNVPFDFGNLFKGKNPFEGAKAWFKKGSRTMKDRMTEMVIRDLDVITEESDYIEDMSKKIDVTTMEENALRQTLRDDITFVSKDYNGAANDGTFEQPYTTVQDGVDNAFGASYVYVDNEGNPYYENVVLRKNVKLWGSGYAEFGCESGVKPIINGSGKTNDNVITLRDNNEIMGLKIKNGGNGIYGNGRSNINIHHNKIYNNKGTGIFIESKSKKDIAGYVISENLIKNNENISSDVGHGISFTIEGGGKISDINILNNVITKNKNDGIDMDSRNGSKYKDVIISGNQIINNNGSGSDGIDCSFEDKSTLTNCLITNNTVNDNASDGIEMDADEGSVFSNLTISNNTVKRSGTDGIDLDADDDSTFEKVVITNNTVNNSDSDGIEMDAYKGSVFSNLTISNNTVNNSGTDAIDVDCSENAKFKQVVITNNTIKKADNHGLEIDLDDSKLVEGLVISNNYIYKVDDIGINLDIDGVKEVSQIQILNNTVIGSKTADGINIYTDDTKVKKLVVSGNMVTENKQDGIDIIVDIGGTIKELVMENNVVIKNGSNGIYLDDDGGTFKSILLGDSTLNEGGFNSIYKNNRSNNGSFDLLNDSGINGLKAENNWWGQDANPKTAGQIGGADSVDVKPWLSADPN
ncbi:MAG: right-handed parallel beta-helix repeat-containing protein, partial [Candidatus Theseobacter exili]|nr:right-handed parallel beta-helix repeat-containing protein [Candidatus Theseobacter exili]